MVGFMIVAIMIFFVAETNAKQELLLDDSPPLSAWLCLQAELERGGDAVSRYYEVFLTKGNFVPMDLYYYDSGDNSYQEVGISIGHKAFSVCGLDFWALPYFVVATDSEYLAPCFWINGDWEKWEFCSLAMYYSPLEKEGVEQFNTFNTYLNYKVTDWFHAGLGGNLSWVNGRDEEWHLRLGPNFTIKDPINIMPGGKGDLHIRFTWGEKEDWRFFLRKTFSF